MAAETVYDYYYGDESSQFSFCRIPRQLIMLLSTPIMSVDSGLRLWYTLFVLIQQIGARPYKVKGT